MIKNITIGSDPEIFFQNENEIVSVEGLIGGTKDEPKLIDKKGFFIQEDNIMAEYNIPPCKTSDEFLFSINYGKNYLNDLAVNLGLSLSDKVSSIINDKYLNTEQAKEFGCSPDNNVYTQEANLPPSSKVNYRSCGGHISVGWDNPEWDEQELLVKAMDITLGLEAVLLDNDDIRKKSYGTAGRFRFKTFSDEVGGIEYRTLSNFWIHSDKLIKWAFNNTIKAVELVNSGQINNLLQYSDSIVNAINTNNKQLVKELLNKININKVKELI